MDEENLEQLSMDEDNPTNDTSDDSQETDESVHPEGSILFDVKKAVNVGPDYSEFDSVLIMHTNTAFMALNQLGVGPEDGYRISGYNEVWTDFISDADLILMEGVKDYVALRVRMLFDPPASSVVAEAFNKGIDELGYRLLVAADFIKQDGET